MLQLKPIDFTTDMPQILALTKAHLDEAFSEDFFVWKHLKNPFGVSFAMGAWDSEQLVGLRMFMRWEFVGPNNTIIKAIRPVDTVTHRDYRGQGIFKSLTLKGLELNHNHFDLVFNTPNGNSLPGYLKMGWQTINLANPFVYALVNPFGTKPKTVSFAKNVQEITVGQTQTGQTHLSQAYLQWRYHDQSFRFIADNDAFVIYKSARFKGFKSIMIYEMSGNINQVASLFSVIAAKEKTPLFYGYFGKRTHELHFKMIFKRNVPVVVFKEDTKSIQEQLTFSLGDLEGKL